MSWIDCAKEYIKKTGIQLTDDEQKIIRSAYGKAMNDALSKGKNLDSVVGEYNINGKKIKKTFIDDFFDKTLQNKNLADGQELTTQLKTQSRLVDIEDVVNNTAEEIKKRENIPGKKIKVSDADAQARALIATVLTTNDTTGHIPLDYLIRTETNNMFGDFDTLVRRAFPDEDFDYDAFIKNKNNKEEIITEIFEIEKRYAKEGAVSDNVISVTGNQTAFKIANAFFKATTHQGKRKLDAMGKMMRMNRFGIKVRFNLNKVKKMGESAFVENIAIRLDETVHGNIDARKRIASDLYTQLQEGNDWRNAGVQVFDDANAFFRAGEKDRGLLVYKDGKSFSELTSMLSDDVSLKHLIASHITETGRVLGLTKFFGPSFDDALEQMRRIIEKTKNTTGTSAMKRQQLEATLGYLKSNVNPRIKEATGFAVTSSILRNIQAGAKLGSAVITAILDIPVFLVTGKRLFGLPMMDLLGQVFNIIPFRGAPKAQRNFARYVLEMQESYLDDVRARFFAGDGVANSTKLQRGSSWFANKIFRLSGLNWWTRTLQASAAGVYTKHLGELVSSRTLWSQLGPDFRRNLDKFGLNEKDWNKLINAGDSILDNRGRLDMYKLEELDLGIIETGASTRNKISAAVADAVDTMVMKPSEFDKLSSALFANPEDWHGSLFRVLTQFKAHPISYTRKTLWRSYKAKNTTDMIQDVAWLSGALVFTGAMVIQLKEFIAGRQGYNWDNPELWTRAGREGGPFGLISDMFMQSGGQELLLQQMVDEKIRFPTAGQLATNHLGPLLNDALNLMASGAGLVRGTQLKYKDLDDGQYLDKKIGDITKMIAGYSGLQRLWWTKMIYRKYLTETLTEFMDPAGYRRRQRKARNDAINARFGNKANNVLFDKLLPDFD